MQDGKRGCFRAHQQAARRALELGARRALTFEDDVEFRNFAPFAGRAGICWWRRAWRSLSGPLPAQDGADCPARRGQGALDGRPRVPLAEGMRRLCSLGTAETRRGPSVGLV